MGAGALAGRERIETSHFDTAALDVAERFEAWRQTIAVCFDVSAYDDKSRERYFAKVDSFLLDDIVLNHCKLGAQVFARSHARIAADGIDHYQFHVFLDGAVEMQCGRRALPARRGDFVVLDHADTFGSRTTDYEILNVFVPRRRLAGQLDRPDSAHGTVFDSRTGAGRLLCDYVVALFQSARNLTRTQAPEAAEALVRLCAMALNGIDLDPDDPPREADRSLLLRAQVTIKNQLHDPGLDTPSLAAATGVSRSRLYALFERYGGVAAYIRELRLRRAYGQLVSPASAHRSIAQIAFDCGFSDPSVFSRAFKARFGCAPRDAREDAAREGGFNISADVSGAGDVKYAMWIANIA